MLPTAHHILRNNQAFLLSASWSVGTSSLDAVGAGADGGRQSFKGRENRCEVSSFRVSLSSLMSLYVSMTRSLSLHSSFPLSMGICSPSMDSRPPQNQRERERWISSSLPSTHSLTQTASLRYPSCPVLGRLLLIVAGILIFVCGVGSIVVREREREREREKLAISKWMHAFGSKQRRQKTRSYPLNHVVVIAWNASAPSIVLARVLNASLCALSCRCCLL